MASQCAAKSGQRIAHAHDVKSPSHPHPDLHTCKVHIARHLGQGRVDELLELHLLVLDVEERLAGPHAGLAVAQRARRVVAVQRLHVQDAEGEGDVADGQRGAARGAHQAQGLDDDLADAVLDVLGQRLDGLVAQRPDAHRLRHVLDVLRVPQQLLHVVGHGCALVGGVVLEEGAMVTSGRRRVLALLVIAESARARLRPSR